MLDMGVWEDMFSDEPMVEVPENLKNDERQLPIESSDMPVIGFRGFYCVYQKGKFLLYSANYRLGYWEPKGPTWAKCRAGDMGEGMYREPDHYVPSPDCTCFTPGTRVLDGSFNWRPLETFAEGDEVISFTEPKKYSKRTRVLVKAKVTKVFRRMAEVIRLTMSDGTVLEVTPDHPFLAETYKAPNGTTIRKWKEAAELGPRAKPCKLIDTWETKTDYDSGWIAGILDGEGHIETNKIGVRLSANGRVVIAQRSGAVQDGIEKYLQDNGYEYSIQSHHGVNNTRVHGKNRGGAVRLVGSTRPKRLLKKLAEADLFGSASGSGVEVVNSEPMGVGEVVNLQTTEGTYLAEGYGVHNCGLYILSNLKDAPTWFGPAGRVLMGGNPNFRQRTRIIDRFNEERIAGVVIAACRGGGIVVRHGEQGWRSEWAEPVAFLGDDALIGGDMELTDAVAEQYNAPILDREGLERYVKEFGNRA